jgi:hypothetical protein
MGKALVDIFFIVWLDKYLLEDQRMTHNGQVLPMVGNLKFVRRNRCLAF